MESNRKYLDYGKDLAARELLDQVYWLCIHHMGRWFLHALHEHADENSGIGFGDFECCLFPRNVLPEEPEYFGDSGVLFLFDAPAAEEDSAIYLTNEEFYSEMCKQSEKYVGLYPEDAEEVAELLEKLKKKFWL